MCVHISAFMSLFLDTFNWRKGLESEGIWLPMPLRVADCAQKNVFEVFLLSQKIIFII